MKSIKTNIILSQSLYDQPLIDRQIQSIILQTISLIASKYGFLLISLCDIERIVNLFLNRKNSFPPVSTEILSTYIAKFKNYGLSIELTKNALLTEPFLLVHTEPELRIDDSQLNQVLASTLEFYTPTYLKQRLDEVNKEISNLSNREIKFLSTSKIHGKREISENLADMINNAREHIYIMLAFYEEDVSFFANFLGNKVLNSELDLKIIYNPKDKKNRQFIRKIHDILNSNVEFFRIYDPSFLINMGDGRFIGNLHSKAVMTETALLVGSANLTAMSMYYNIETAIYTNDIQSVQSANDFFVNLWGRLRAVGAI